MSRKTLQLRLNEMLSKAYYEMIDNGIDVNFRVRAFILQLHEQFKSGKVNF